MSILVICFQDKTVFGLLGPDWEHYDQLLELILEKGSVGGCKAYFPAFVDEKEGLKINIEQIQLAQPWWRTNQASPKSGSSVKRAAHKDLILHSL